MSKPVVHPSAVVGSQVRIGPGTSIGPRCRIDGDTRIGARCRFVENAVFLEAASIGDDCLIEAGVTMASVSHGPAAEPLRLGPGVHVGAGSVLMRGTRIGANAQIRGGAVVERDVPPHAIIAGDPGTIVGFSTTQPIASANRLLDASGADAPNVGCDVDGVTLHRFPILRDARGALSVGEFARHCPFAPQRWFLVYDVPAGEARGAHTHEVCEELLICAKGRLSVVVDDGTARQEITLDTPGVGLHLPPLVWATQYRHSPDAVLLVFASHPYDTRGYVRDYEDFIARRARRA